MTKTVQGVQGCVQGFITHPAQQEPHVYWLVARCAGCAGVMRARIRESVRIIVSIYNNALTRTRTNTPAHPAHPAHALFYAGLTVQGYICTPAHPAHARFYTHITVKK